MPPPALFDEDADIFLGSADVVVVHLDLPEIEDVIPETYETVLKSGEIREKKRTRGER